MEELIKNLTARDFRSRFSACMGLCDILTGRKFEHLGKYLTRIWDSLFKVYPSFLLWWCLLHIFVGHMFASA